MGKKERKKRKEKKKKKKAALPAAKTVASTAPDPTGVAKKKGKTQNKKSPSSFVSLLQAPCMTPAAAVQDACLLELELAAVSVDIRSS